MKTTWNDITVVFGGRFDPPHIGHREAIRGVFINPGVKRVIVLPSAKPPHKSAAASIEDRLAMVNLSFRQSGHFFSGPIEINTHEIDRAKTGSKPNFTYDTLSELRREIHKIAFVIGADQLEEMSRSWYRFPEVLDLANWLVLARQPDGNDLARQTLQKWEMSSLVKKISDNEWATRGDTVIGLFETDAPKLSSTEIREQIARSGQAPEGSLLPEVEEYLKHNRLYGSHNS